LPVAGVLFPLTLFWKFLDVKVVTGNETIVKNENNHYFITILMNKEVLQWPRSTVKLGEKEFSPISLCSPLCCRMPGKKITYLKMMENDVKTD
jgi:hypothetical protein